MAKFNAVHRVWSERGAYKENPYQYLTRFLLKLRAIGQFVTMSEALAGDYPKNKPCFALDHHIDYYPLETMELVKWEMENGIRSSVYLFNRYDSRLRESQVDWNVSDLDIGLLQRAQSNGFEIGYHVNAVGLAKAARGKVERYGKQLDPELVESAKRNFADDVSGLREHFSIKTAVPHGAGEGNNLVDLGYRENSIEPVYNSRALDIAPNIQWRNFTDSVSKYYNKLNSQNSSVYMSSQDRFGSFVNLVENRLYHILIHPGRYGEGMAYDNYGYQLLVSENDVQETAAAREQINTNTSAAWLFSRKAEALYDALKSGASERLCLILEERFSPEIKQRYKVPRPVKTTVECPQSIDEFLSEYYWYDTLFCPKGFTSIKHRLENETYSVV